MVRTKTTKAQYKPLEDDVALDESVVKTTKRERPEPTVEANVDDLGDYESRENDTVRIYTSKKELLPGVFVESRVFRVYLTEDKDEGSFLEFREPNTKECLDTIEKNKQKQASANKKGKGFNPTSGEGAFKFISSLSVGEIELTNSLMNALPIKFQFRIIRTVEYIVEIQGTQLNLL